jgi:hypothetical protein
MLIIVDKKIPQDAKRALSHYGELLELQTSGITYEAISGHPDIFFHQINAKLLIAPNLPEEYKQILSRNGLEFVAGEQAVGKKYPASSTYNAVSTGSHLIHNFRHTDAVISAMGGNAGLIHVDQGYTRCNLIPLDDHHFISSDHGIQRVLERFEKDCLYVDPKGIILKEFQHGFFGGCCGLHQGKMFLLGTLDHYPEGDRVEQYLSGLQIEIIELYNGPLFDGGSILFTENN